jgi:hypothetical protein
VGNVKLEECLTVEEFCASSPGLRQARLP